MTPTRVAALIVGVLSACNAPVTTPPPPPGCDAATCGGCCAGNTCVAPSDESQAQCGPGGAACTACAANQGCDGASGACRASPIRHVVLIVQENHTFDSYFGHYCTAAAHSSPSCTSGRACCEAAPSAEPGGAIPGVLTDDANLDHDRDHEQSCELQQLHGGLMDQFVTGATGAMTCSGTGPKCSDPLNWMVADSNTVAFYWSLADRSALADRYFQPIAGSSSSNDVYLAGARFHFVDDSRIPTAAVGESAMGLCDQPVCFDGTRAAPYAAPTVADLLLDAGYSFAIYADGYDEARTAAATNACASKTATTECPYRDCVAHPVSCYGCLYDPSDIPFLYFSGFADGPSPTPFAKDLNALGQDLDAGALPSFSFVKLRLFRNEHPNTSTVSDGVAAVTGLLDQLQRSSAWSSTLVLLTWDEGGGFFDHVPPPAALPLSADSDDGGKPVPYGTRVPFIAIGPFAAAGQVSHVTMEHSSVIRFLELNFLGSEGQLGARDGVVNGLGSLLDAGAVGFAFPACNHSCGGRACGVSGCGDPCGACPQGQGCAAGTCVSCTAADAGACMSGKLSCGAGCCPSDHPFYCPSNGGCYASADGAAAACGATCVACR